ncbi:putative MFS transporter Seo1 [Aspergillus aculeatinus CBS 121060]|uniref:MFS general substrate transporter n=1 Tax=Aspergillus aculeatinus CBS 121060 TaxID=1448322 RepID=A0ACD1HFR5_9EURO|nr:MFS general substrate transporter [Aspergillus aculeatinus CBS 121060]RAH72463.1 MFS general substrate transporter [Aspergillus aculeatinus CBS 121060]
MTSPKQRRWYQMRWFSENDTLEDKKLILKLDALIVPYAFLSYWTKYIDQANLNNAYVSGMQEEIGLGGDDLVNLQTMYTVGAVVGQLPFAYLFTRVPISWLIPIMDIAWGIFTLLQYRATSYSEMMAYRFLVGWFEAAFFPGMHYIFGAWYRGDEIARRGGCFYVGLTLGTLTASLIQAGASSRLDGVSGLAGWRWMFIICAIITIPIGILGFFVLPGTPDKPNRLILRQEDIQRGRERLERTGHRFTSSGFSTLQTCRSLLKSQKFYIFLVLDVLFWNAGLHASAGGYLLWLKSLQRFSTATLNNLSAIAPALGIFYTLFVCFLSDLWLGPAWAIVLAHTWNSLGLIILTIWEVPESAKWFAFSTIYACVAMSSVLYGWVNTELRYSPQERAVVLVVINAVSQSTTAWTPLLVFPTVEGPRFTKGYAFTLGSALALIVGTIGVWAVFRRKAMVSNGEEEEEIVVVQGKRDGKTEGTEQ